MGVIELTECRWVSGATCTIIEVRTETAVAITARIIGIRKVWQCKVAGCKAIYRAHGCVDFSRQLHFNNPKANCICIWRRLKIAMPSVRWARFVGCARCSMRVDAVPFDGGNDVIGIGLRTVVSMHLIACRSGVIYI